MGAANRSTATVQQALAAAASRTPVRQASRARSGSPAPTHWPAMVVTALPTAQQGMAAKVLIFSPTPAAAATTTP